MPFFLVYMNSNYIHITIANLNDVPDSKLKQFRHYVTESIHSKLRLRQSLASYYYLNNLTLEQAGQSLEDLGFTKTSIGKPFFKSNEHLYCSISHSHNNLAVGLASHNFGLDIELIEEENTSDLRIAFSNMEWERVKGCAKSIFTEISYKESIGKLLGTGFTIDPASIKVDKNQYWLFDEEITLNEKNYIFTLASEKEKIFGLKLYNDQNFEYGYKKLLYN